MQIEITPSKILFCLCLAFIAGIGVESLIKIPQVFLWIFLFLAIVLVVLETLSFPRKRESRVLALTPGFRVKPGMTTIIGFCCFAMLLGVLRMQVSQFNIANDKLAKWQGKEVILQGIVAGEPDLRETSQKILVRTGNEKILITTKRYPEFHYLDAIKIIGKLEAPPEFEDFSYKNYLQKDGVYSVMGFPKIQVLEQEKQYSLWTWLYEKILFAKEKLRESIKSNFAPPQSSILQGTILGDNSAMSDQLKTNLNITGLRHIIAVSGTHVVILGAIIMGLFLWAGLWRRQAFYLTVIFIWVYVVLTGLSASGVRAGIMGCLFLLAQNIGRQAVITRIIFLAGAVMLFLNPLLLAYDVGFQLSFLAVLGLAYFDPLFKKLLKFLPENWLNFSTILTATLSAQITTLPIMVFNFGNISFIAPLTNILVSPIVQPLMVLGFLSSFAGIFLSLLGTFGNFLSRIFSVPSYLLLSYFVWVINFFSKPWAMVIVPKNNFSYLIFLAYIPIIALSRYLRKKFLSFTI